MQRFHHYAGTGVGSRHSDPSQPERNRYTSKISKQAAAQIAEMGLTRVAGNVYECPSSKDLWKINEKTGGIERLTSGEVDNGEKIAPAPKESSSDADFLQGILAELEF